MHLSQPDFWNFIYINSKWFLLKPFGLTRDFEEFTSLKNQIIEIEKKLSIPDTEGK